MENESIKGTPTAWRQVMWTKHRNIRSILFSTYSFIIVIVFTVLVAWFYVWASDLLRKNATDTLESMGQSMQDNIDSEFHKLNDVSLNVMYSNLVKNHFQSYLSLTTNSEEKQQENVSATRAEKSVQNAKELTDILTAAIGPSRPVEQLYLYDFKSKVYGNGFDNGERTYLPQDKPWFNAVMNNAAGKYIALPVPDEEMSRFISSQEKQFSISLFRLFYDNYNTPMGIIEVKQYFNRIFKSAIDFTERNPYQAKVLVYNNANEIIYPTNADKERYLPYLRYKETDGTAGDQSFYNQDTGEKALLSLHYSDFTGLSTVIIVSENKLLSPLFTFAKRTVLVALVILLLAILLSFLAAKRITMPIQKIHRSMRTMRLEDLGSERVATPQLNSGLNELDQLYWSFMKMSARLKQSMDDLLMSQYQELQAKLIALQTQMNPHFLYNTLTTIQVMAQENMNAEIVAMTENMSDFLRYFSADGSLVALKEEVLHTRKYLEINQIRFGRKVHFEFDIDEQLTELRIPKLIIQPLVENALKFATKHQPPWTIRVSGTISAEHWQVEVADTGDGFSEESLVVLHRKIKEIDKTNVLPLLQLNGMGLLNIYIRMKLMYGNNTIFRIVNGQGATVIIGGTLTQGGINEHHGHGGTAVR
ncbi:histidine kinase [Paenibacillus sp. PFR10]|uniref:Histidine kinase n=2 Tax=Paenibacillus TaxID=44249 RepID=A0ABU3R8U3_9BACL|nr:histidine kinase [Paenibacillus sp. PFR10]MDU0200662.1 histidine kinase [Paenibacillus sp. PFR10]